MDDVFKIAELFSTQAGILGLIIFVLVCMVVYGEYSRQKTANMVIRKLFEMHIIKDRRKKDLPIEVDRRKG